MPRILLAIISLLLSPIALSADNTYTVSWDDPNPPEKQVTGYAAAVSGPGGTLYDETVSTKFATFTIDTEPEEIYTFSVAAVNAAGESPPAMAQIQEGFSVPGGPPTYISTYESIGIYWTPPGSGDCDVEYRVDGTSTWRDGYPLWYDNRPSSMGGNSECRGSLVLLTPGTTYNIKVSQGATTETFDAETWPETDTLPIAKTIHISSGDSTFHTTESGSPAGYVVYDGAGSTRTKHLRCVSIEHDYVFVRNLTCDGGSIEVEKNAPRHDIIIENNFITNWGSSETNWPSWWGGVHVSNDNNHGQARRITVQRNMFKDAFSERVRPFPKQKGGAMGVHLRYTWGNHVVRYNTFWATQEEKWLWDTIGGAGAFDGFGVANDSDFYGNYIKGCVDDCMELEGGGRNLRAWGNFMRDQFIGIAIAPVSVGPAYLWRNIETASGIQTWTSDDHTGGIKVGGDKNLDTDPENGGRAYVFHNLFFNTGDLKSVGHGGDARNIYMRNNVFDAGVREEDCWQPPNNWDYDIYGDKRSKCNVNALEPHGWQTQATFASTPTADPRLSGWKGNYALASGTTGHDDGVLLPNFNDGYIGVAPDLGAQELGGAPIEFGTTAYVGETWGGGEISPQPMLAITAEDSAYIGDSVGFTADGTNCTVAGGGWSWTFEDGTPATSTDAEPSVSWASGGVKAVTVTNTGCEGATGTHTVTVTATSVTILPPSNGSTTDSYDFSAATLGCSPGASGWDWDFGSGATPATSTAESPTGVTYSTSGNKTVTVTNSVCNDATDEILVLVTEPCEQINEDDTLPYGEDQAPPWWVFDADGSKRTTIKAECSLSEASVDIMAGIDDDSSLVYRDGYISVDGGPWTAITYTGTAHPESSDGMWLQGLGTVSDYSISVPDQQGGSNYVLAYICRYVDGVAECGCQDDEAGCDATGLWSVQRIELQ